MRLTVEKVLETDPCSSWTRERIEALIAPRKYVLHGTALRDSRVPIDDRIWLGIALLDDSRRRLFACDCAEWSLGRERDAGHELDPRSWAAVEVARRYARGEATDEELTAARAAAWAAAWAAAGNSARAAAWDSARNPARTAARDSAWAAARAAAWAAERSWQIERLITYLGAAS
uniref:Uncharacterized protein n=1 Tax=viral metagenome TaxID=1070528 RepID=A0A6M3J9T7_9ZZZZ